MKILITGHKGFIGQKLIDKYAGHNITGIDILNGVDARDFFRKDETHYDLVYHMAGVIGGRRGIEHQPLSVAVDLSIDAEYFNWIERTNPTDAVYMSSSAAYPTRFQTHEFVESGLDGRLHESDIDLADVENPDYTYGWSKLTGEYLAQFVTKTKMHIFRPFSGYGETQSLDYPFPSFIARGKRKDDPFEVWGTGTATRDFIHVDDIVNAMDTAIREEIEGPVNIGNGRATNFNELATMVMTEAGYVGRIEHLTSEPVGVDYRVCDNTKLLSFYTPKISLEEGIRRALNA